MGRVYLPIISFLLMISASMTAWGVVNQNLGVPDTQFINMPTEKCRECHGPNRFNSENPTGLPMLNSMNLTDRHHQHVGTGSRAVRDGLVAGGSVLPPRLDGNNDGVVDANDARYTCYNCHAIMLIGPNGEIAENFRKCENCHIVEDGERTVHHDTPKAKEGQCAACHGYLVRNLDEVRPPGWRPSMTTPWASGKPNGDTDITSPSGTHPGNCDFCHNAAELVVDVMGVIRIFSNEDTHHATGVPTITGSSKGPTCNWCHNYDRPENEGIRICERCHAVDSLHSIQADVAGDGVVPLEELPYQGHIGNAEDCWGCHGFSFDAAMLSDQSAGMGSPGTGATIPQLESLSELTWEEGATFEMTLSGNGFINQGGLDNVVTYRPTVQLTDSDGNVTVLSPIAESVDSVQVAIPGLLPAGNYHVQIKKDDKFSNPIGVAITPTINVRPGGAVCLSEYRVVILRGDGFNTYMPGAPSSVTGIIGDGVDASRLFLWRDGMVAARFNAGCPSTITVNNVFDSVTLTPEIR